VSEWVNTIVVIPVRAFLPLGLGFNANLPFLAIRRLDREADEVTATHFLDVVVIRLVSLCR
jgi:hypothetical protein